MSGDHGDDDDVCVLSRSPSVCVTAGRHLRRPGVGSVRARRGSCV